MKDVTISISPKIDELPGILKEIARVIGVDNAVKLAREFSGGHLYIPSIARLEKKERDQQMRAEYDQGSVTVAKLARKYRVSERTAWTILGKPNT
ncbi:MAG: Mor transcription activator family protein [Desulfobulbus sp.]